MDTAPLEIIVDADACPVKDEIYRVAKRYGLTVNLVANVPLWVSASKQAWVKTTVVKGRMDAADDWIAENVGAHAIVITGDIPLAARCLEKGASVLDSKGGQFTQDRIAEALASREILSHLREQGLITGGPAPFENKDRSKFLQTLDQVIQAMKRMQKNQADKSE
jgi:uncharacterized protein YaiI (UPF0178 family)